MLRKVYCLGPAVLLLLVTQLYSQGHLRTPEQVLTQAGISLEKDSLIQALGDNRVAILASAATVLAEKGAKEAVPVILSRMKEEQDKRLVLTLAQNLNILGSNEGTVQLEKFCVDKDVDTGERMRAAYDLIYTNNYSCMSIMPELLNSGNDEEKQSALLYLLHIPSPQSNAPKALGQALLGIASGDSDMQFRALAKKVILQIGDAATKTSLEKSSTANPQ